MTRVRRGHDTERKCALELKKRGYDVIRSAGSKGVWDIVAVNKSFVLLIQCKRTLKTIKSAAAPKAVMNKMRRAPAPEHYVVRKELWTWVDRQGWTVTVVI